MASKVKRTYSSRVRAPLPCSSPSTPSPTPPFKRKRPFAESFSSNSIPPPKKRATIKSKSKSSTTQKSLTQLHFTLDNNTSILRTCPLCDLSYTKGAPDDEELHKAHCARVVRGMEWGREEERQSANGGVVGDVERSVRLKDGRKGRIVCFRADIGGKIGSKLTTLLETINLALSSPPLTAAALQVSKAYLLLLPISSSSHREKIVGCVIAQRISTAMAIATAPPITTSPSPSPRTLIPVDPTTSLFCHPTPLPTPLGIPRLFVPSTHRHQGVASHLLSAAARTFIHGCPLDPALGQVAFSQPTGAGAGVMRAWGGGGVRIFEE